MDLEKIRRYSAQRFEEIRRHFELACQAFDPEAIHQLRVEIKRLRAFFQLLESLSAGVDAKQSLLPVRPVYKSAGRIRDLQVQAGMARQWAEDRGIGLDAFRQHLEKLEEEAQASFAEESRRFDSAALDAIEESAARALSSLTARQARRRAEELLEGLQGDLLQGGLESGPEDDLHPLRILAKRTRHTTELLQMCLSSSPPPDEVVETLQAIDQALGSWHDQAVALEFVESFQTDSGFEPACQEYEQSLTAKKAELRQAFLQALPTLSCLLEHRSR